MISQQPIRGPWASNDVLVLVALQAIGLGLVVGAWYGSSVTADPFGHVPWLVAGTLGVVIASFGCVVWLLNGRRRVGERFWMVASSVVIDDGAAASLSADPVVVVLPGTDAFHRPDCLLVIGKPVQASAFSEQLRADRASCRMCCP